MVGRELQMGKTDKKNKKKNKRKGQRPFKSSQLRKGLEKWILILTKRYQGILYVSLIIFRLFEVNGYKIRVARGSRKWSNRKRGAWDDLHVKM